MRKRIYQFSLLNNIQRKKIMPNAQIPRCILGPCELDNPIIEKIKPKFSIGFEKLGLTLFF